MPLAAFKKLYEIEGEIRDEAVAHKGAVRQARSKPIYDELLAWCEAHKPHEPPTSPLGAALRYLTNHQVALRRFLDDPDCACVIARRACSSTGRSSCRARFTSRSSPIKVLAELDLPLCAAASSDRAPGACVVHDAVLTLDERWAASCPVVCVAPPGSSPASI